MKKFTVLLLLAGNGLFAHDNYRSTKSMLVMMNLTSNVKSVKETSYKAVVKNGVAEKGKQQRQKSSWEFQDKYDWYCEFNKDGNLSEKTFFKSNGDVEHKT